MMMFLNKLSSKTNTCYPRTVSLQIKVIVVLDNVETGCDLFMEKNTFSESLIVHSHTGLIVVIFYLLVRKTPSIIFKQVTFYN